jgi:ribosome-associated protein
MADDDLIVPGLLTIPEDEIRELASRAGGPGGQHVNKSNTRVTLRWNIRGSRALSDRQRQRLLSALKVKLTREGEIVVHADRMRSRGRNRSDARLRIVRLVTDALAENPIRRATRPSKGSINRVRTIKKHRSEVKRNRRPVPKGSD